MANIIIGNSLGALRQAYRDKCVLFVNGPAPFPFLEEREEWDKLYAWLSLNSLIPFGDILSGLTILDDEAKVQAAARGVRREYDYEQLYVYNDDDVRGLEHHLLEECETFDVHDIFHIKNVQPSTLVDFAQEQDFMRENFTFSVHRETFYCSRSTLTKQQLADVNFSEPIARLSMLQLLPEKGVLGSKNGRCAKTGKTKRISIKLSHRERIKTKNSLNKYSPIDNVHFCTTFKKLTEMEYNLLNEPLKPFSGNNPYLQKTNVL